jgi:hypothetical protein
MPINSTLELSSQALPKDLVITSQPDSVDKDKFKVVASGLKVNVGYAFQFQYVFADGTMSEWSPGYSIGATTEAVPTAPVTTITGGAGFIKVELPTFPANASRVDIRIAGGTFGSGAVVTDSFTSAGTKTIAAAGSASPGLAYIVTLLTVTPTKINGDPSDAVTVYVTDPAASIVVEPSVTPSTPTVSSVLGAIQLSWNGKRADGTDQPAGFKAAKVYVGTTSDFIPVDSGSAGANQVDVLNFSNGQNTLNIGVGTIVNGVALTYNTDYYVKIKTTNGNVAQDSSAVSATGNPKQLGKAGNDALIEISADKILTGTISSQIVTVGAVGGKSVVLRGTGNPIEIFGTGGISLLSYDTGATKLTITGDGTFTGNITGASGTFSGNLSASSGLFSVNNGILTASSGTIGGWSITGSLLHSATVSNSKIELNPATPKISLQTGGVDKITIDPIEGIKGPAIGGNSAFQFQPSGNFSMGAGKITFDGTTLTVQNTKLKLGITTNYDGTAGDNTVNIAEGTGELTTGRAFFYGSTVDPRTGYYGSRVNTRYEYYEVSGSYQGASAFSPGDIWMQRE